MTKASRTTMEGMIIHANHVLDTMLDPKTPGIPRDFLSYARGVVLVSTIEAGFIFSGNVGTGVIMARDDTGEWSPPSALAMGGVGFGFLFGANVKDILILLMDDAALNALSGEAQVKLGGDLNLTVGPVGREMEGSFNFSNRGVGITLTYCMSKGIFAGAGLQGAILGARSKENQKFYGVKASPRAILKEGAVAIPKEKGIEALHHKLKLMEKGETCKPGDLYPQLIQKLHEESMEAERKAMEEPDSDIVYVDGKKEAAKES